MPGAAGAVIAKRACAVAPAAMAVVVESDDATQPVAAPVPGQPQGPAPARDASGSASTDPTTPLAVPVLAIVAVAVNVAPGLTAAVGSVMAVTPNSGAVGVYVSARCICAALPPVAHALDRNTPSVAGAPGDVLMSPGTVIVEVLPAATEVELRSTTLSAPVVLPHAIAPA